MSFPVTLSDGNTYGVAGYLFYQGSYHNRTSNRVGSVNGPVLVQLGEHDALFPASLAGGEAAFYTSASSVTVQTIPGVGHDVNTHLLNHTSWRLMDEWLRAAGLRSPAAE